MRRSILTDLSVCAVLALSVLGCDIHGGDPEPIPEPEPAPDPEPAPIPRTVDIELAAPQFEAYRELLGQARLDELRGRDEVTLFAPTNAALDAIPGACLTIWINDGRIDELLRHQVVLGPAFLDRDGLIFTAESDDPFLPMGTIEAVLMEGSDADLRVDGRLVEPQIVAANGVIHPYSERVLLPASLEDSLEADCRDR